LRLPFNRFAAGGSAKMKVGKMSEEYSTRQCFRPKNNRNDEVREGGMIPLPSLSFGSGAGWPENLS
jgi:hypothetical protein